MCSFRLLPGCTGQINSAMLERRASLTDSMRLSQMELCCANMSQRCNELELVIQHLQSSQQTQPRLSLQQGSAALATSGPQREYRVTVTSPSRAVSEASTVDASLVLRRQSTSPRPSTDTASAPLDALQLPGKQQQLKPLKDGTQSAGGSGSDWKIAAESDSAHAGDARPGNAAQHSQAAMPAPRAASGYCTPEEVGQAEDAAGASKQQLAAAVRRITDLEDQLEESQEQTAALMQHLPSLQQQHEGMADLHATLEGHILEMGGMQARLVEAQQALGVSQRECHDAVAQLALEHASLTQSQHQAAQLQAALSQSQAEAARLAACHAAAQAACEAAEQELLQGKQQQAAAASELQEDVAAAKGTAAQALHVLTSLCAGDSADTPGSISSQSGGSQGDQSLQGILSVVLTLANEAASMHQQLQWRAADRWVLMRCASR